MHLINKIRLTSKAIFPIGIFNLTNDIEMKATKRFYQKYPQYTHYNSDTKQAQKMKEEKRLATQINKELSKQKTYSLNQNGKTVFLGCKDEVIEFLKKQTTNEFEAELFARFKVINESIDGGREMNGLILCAWGTFHKHELRGERTFRNKK